MAGRESSGHALVRGGPVARAFGQHQHLRARIAHGHAGGQSRRGPAGIPLASPLRRPHAPRAGGGGQAVRLLEYFHTASLLFDDLPCMDDAQERRGVPCAHVVFGQAGAILAALALINRAYALTWSAVARTPQRQQPQALAYLERRLGVGGLLNGQSLDLHYFGLPHTRQMTDRIAQGKTVSLIRLTLVLPAMLGQASSRDIHLLERIALCWGLARSAE